jgi:plastocyanin
MATQQVHIKEDHSFDPDPVSIEVGDTVEWIWDDDGHSTTADDGSWDSGVLNTGSTYSHAFPNAGSFPYYCSIHGGPGGVGMSSTVNVS